MNIYDEQVLQPMNRATRPRQEGENKKQITSNYLETENFKYQQEGNQSYLLQGNVQNNRNCQPHQNIIKKNDQYQGQFNDNPYYNQAVFDQPCRISILTQSQNQIQNYVQKEEENIIQHSEQTQSQEPQPIEQYYNQKERYQDLRQKYYNQNEQQSQGYGNNLYAQASILTSKYQFSRNQDNSSQKVKQSDPILESENQYNNRQYEQKQNIQQEVKKDVNTGKNMSFNTQVQQQQTQTQQTICYPQTRQNYDNRQLQINQQNNYDTRIIEQKALNTYTPNQQQYQQPPVQMQQKYRERLQYLDELKARIPHDGFFSQQEEPNYPPSYTRQAPRDFQQNQIRPQPTTSRLQDQTEKMYQSTRTQYSDQQLRRNGMYTESRKNQREVREDSYEREKNFFYQKTSHLKQNSQPQNYSRR